MNSLWREVKYATRLIWRKPWESAISVLMVAFGLAISLVIFQVLFNTQYKLFDINDAGKWSTVTLTHNETGMLSNTNAVSDFSYYQLQSGMGSFKAMGAMQGTRETAFNFSDAQEIATILVASSSITPELFELMGVVPEQGRGFLDDDIEGDNPSVVILAYEAWQNIFNATPSIIGEDVRLDGQALTVIGVMPEGAQLPYHFDFLLPLRVNTATDPATSSLRLTAFGLLADYANPAIATLEAQAIYLRLSEQYPDIYSPDYAISVSSLRGGIADSSDFNIGAMLWVFALIILLLVSLNVGNLLFSRSLERRQEFAVRTAVGSSRWQIVYQCLLESFFLCFAGMVMGILIAITACNLFAQMAGDMTILGSAITRGDQNIFDINGGSVFVAFLAGTLVWLVSSLIPALSFSVNQVEPVLKGSGSSVTDGAKFRTTKIVVGFEIIISVFLLILCGGLVGSMSNLAKFDYGFETADKLISRVRLPSDNYESLASRQRYFESLQLNLESRLGERKVAYVSSLPFEVAYTSYNVSENNTDINADVTTQFLLSISDNYFEVLNVPLLEGRSFDSGDSEHNRAVAIIDELLAARLWPDQSAIGKTVTLGANEFFQDVVIVGVAAHVSQANSFLNGDQVGTFYRPMSQYSSNDFALLVELQGGVSVLRELLGEGDINQDRNVAFYDTSTFEDYLLGKSMHFQLFAELFLWIAVIATVIASVGIYGIISRSVAQRTKEMGIRRALGAKNADVLRIFLWQGFSFLLVGCLVGGTLGVLTTAALASAFIDILDFLPVVLLASLLCTGLLIFFASWFPARRAVVFEPGEALHYE